MGYHTISRYPRADYVCLAEPELRLEARDRRGDLKDMLKDVSDKLKCSRVMVTRGKNGCLGYDVGSGYFPAPAFADKVIDLTGSRSEKRFVPYEEAYGRPFDDMMRRVPCLERIQEAIGYAPSTGLDEILRLVIEEKRRLMNEAAS